MVISQGDSIIEFHNKIDFSAAADSETLLAGGTRNGEPESAKQHKEYHYPYQILI